MKNLSHSASFHCWSNNASLKSGIKHLAPYWKKADAQEGIAAARVELEAQFAVRHLPVAPLLAVDRAEIALFVGPFVPHADLVSWR